MYLYPENLTARPMLWLWTLRDVAWIGTGLLLSVLALTQTGSMIPLVITAALPFSAFGTEGSVCWTSCAMLRRFSFSDNNIMSGGNRHEQEKIYPAAHRHR